MVKSAIDVTMSDKGVNLVFLYPLILQSFLVRLFSVHCLFIPPLKNNLMKLPVDKLLDRHLLRSNPETKSKTRNLLRIQCIVALSFLVFVVSLLPVAAQTSDETRAVLITGTSSGAY